MEKTLEMGIGAKRIMKVYVLLWDAGHTGWEIEGVTADKELAEKWKNSGQHNHYKECTLTRTQAEYDKWYMKDM